jgi:hypothetical protein
MLSRVTAPSRSTSDRTVTRLITDLSYECKAGLQGFPYLRLDNSFLQVAITILQTAQRNGVLNSLIDNPNPVPRKVWRTKKAHGSTNTAG